MTWYYQFEGKQQGPVSDGELDTLLREGKIDRNTLIWRVGMTEWKPFATGRPSASPPPPTLGLAGNKCVECGQTFPPDQLITVNKSTVCAGCKQVFLQRLTEGVGPAGGAGLWRQGKKIVTTSENPFPDRCVKCNAPTNGYRLKRVLYWQHPAYYLLLLCNLLVLLIVVLIVRKKAVLHIGLCDAHQKQRKVAIIACWLGLLGGLAMICVGVAMPSGWLILAGVVAFFGGAIWGGVKGRTLTPTKIDKENVWVTGAGKDFLDQLPEWPG
jgi:hypothetical protein